MLEGLEAVEINLSNVIDSSDDFRIHSEFYKKKFLINQAKLRLFDSQPLSTYAKVSDGDHAKFPDNQTREIRYLQARDINNNFLEISSDSFVSKKYLKKNKRSLIEGENILLSIMGTVGDITITPTGFEPAMCNRALAIIKDISGISPQFLFTYLTSQISLIEIERLTNGGVQQRINLEVLREVRVPKLNVTFQSAIESLVLSAYDTRSQSKKSYKQAEHLLLKEIGLLDFEPSQEPVNIKSFKDSLGTSGRLDAEYYQKKYDDFIDMIQSYAKGSESISKCCNVKIKNFKPEDDKEYQYIELSNIGNSGTVQGCTTGLGKDLPSRARRQVKTGDVIISSIEGSLTSCALVTEQYNQALCSTGFYVIDSDEINPETLLVLFKSGLLQNLLKQACSGTILTAINKDDFLNMTIPLIDGSKQQQIAKWIEKSFSLKKQSEHLLEVAKRAVEIAIEESEVVARDYINAEVSERVRGT